MLRTLHLKQSRAFPLMVTCTLLFSLAITTLVDTAVPLHVHAANHAACESPPAGFDPTASTVTNATLVKYGYPLRPSSSTSSSSYQWWLKKVKNVKHHVCTTSTSTVSSSNQAKASRQSQTMMPLTFNDTKYYTDFAGYEASNSSISAITGTWVVQCPAAGAGGGQTDTIELFSSSGGSRVIAIGVRTEASGSGNGSDTYQFAAVAGSGLASDADPTVNPIHCGDVASASITHASVDPAGNISGPIWYAWVDDDTTGSAYTLSVSASSVGTGYWGEMAGNFSYPITNTLLPFVVNWSGVTIDLGTGDQRPLSNYSPSIAYMKNSSLNLVAYPGALDSSGGGFTNTTYNAS